MVTSAAGAVLRSGRSDSRQRSRSALTPIRSFPPVDRAGGAAWFSWEKKLLMSPSRVWQEMYSLEKRPQSLFSAASCAFCFELFLGWWPAEEWEIVLRKSLCDRCCTLLKSFCHERTVLLLAKCLDFPHSFCHLTVHYVPCVKD